MNAMQIFKKTMKFVWIRLGTNIAISIGAILWTVMWLAIAAACNNTIVSILAFVAVCSLFKIVGLVKMYAGYMVKSAHIAVVANAFQTGNIPDNMVEFGKERVKQKFAQANAYILLDKLVAGSIRQINRTVNKAFEWLTRIIPQAEILGNVIQKFTEMSLTYVDECCLCYTFMNDNQSAFKSAADGVVIYFQNWKGLLKHSAKSTGIVLVIELICIGLIYGVVMTLAGTTTSMGWILAIVVAFCIVFSLRDAFLNSYMMIYTMENFMKEVNKGVISHDLYGKLCDMSAKFRDLVGRAGVNINQPAYAAAGGTPPMHSTQQLTQSASGFCPHCGTPNTGNTPFCSNCGTDLRN